MKLHQIHVMSNDEQQPTTKPSHSTLVYPIKIYLNFLYFLGASPFRCVSYSDKNRCVYYYKTVSRPQQVMCGFLHILCIFRLISQIRDAFPAHSVDELRNPTPYFSIVDEICSFFFKTVTMKRLWLNGNDYVRILNTIANEKHLSVDKQWVLKPLVLYIFYGFFTLKAFFRLMVSTSLLQLQSKWTFSGWIYRLIDQAQFVFFFSEHSESVQAQNSKGITVGNGIMAFLMMFTNYIRLIFSEFCDLFIFAITLTLWSATNSFYKEINDNLNAHYRHDMHMLSTSTKPEPTLAKQTVLQFWKNIYKKFQSIQILSEVVNFGTGSQVGWFLAEGLMYYSIYLNVMLVKSDLFVKFSNLVFFIISFTTLYLSADICNQVIAAKVWLTKKSNIKLVPMEEAQIIRHETILKDIGIRGNNVFTITFPFVGAYLSLIVTFFIFACKKDIQKQHELIIMAISFYIRDALSKADAI